jgi:hypothetical protein
MAVREWLILTGWMLGLVCSGKIELVWSTKTGVLTMRGKKLVFSKCVVDVG